MSRAWMPLYVADYLADTGHLSTAEHGAYLLLIMHYWSNGGLPNDERKLARIARMTPDEWDDAGITLKGFFDAEWRHKRIDQELVSAQAAYDRRAAAGRRGGYAKADSASNAKAMPEQCQSENVAMLKQSQSQSHILSSKEDNTREATPAAILSECLSEQTASDIIAHRKAKKAKLTARAARELVKAFNAHGDPEAAAAEMIARGWTGFKPEWMGEKARGSPGNNTSSRNGFASLWLKSNGYSDAQSSEARLADKDVSELPRLAVDERGDGGCDSGGVSGNLIELYAANR